VTHPDAGEDHPLISLLRLVRDSLSCPASCGVARESGEASL